MLKEKIFVLRVSETNEAIQKIPTPITHPQGRGKKFLRFLTPP